MEEIEIECKEKIYKINKEIIVYVLYRLSGKDFSNKSNKEILKAMEKFCLINEMTLESMQTN